MARGADDYKPGPDSQPQAGVAKGALIKDDLPACIDRTRPASFIQASIKSVTPSLSRRRRQRSCPVHLVSPVPGRASRVVSSTPSPAGVGW